MQHRQSRSGQRLSGFSAEERMLRPFGFAESHVSATTGISGTLKQDESTSAGSLERDGWGVQEAGLGF